MRQKGGQHVGPSVGTFARLKQENQDLQLKDKDLKTRVQNLEDELCRRHRIDTDTIEQLRADMDLLVHQNEKLQVELRDRDDAYRAVMGEKCSTDEVHCTCVPALRKEVERLQADLEVIKGDARRWRSAAEEYVKFEKTKHDPLLTAVMKYMAVTDDDEQLDAFEEMRLAAIACTEKPNAGD